MGVVLAYHAQAVGARRLGLSHLGRDPEVPPGLRAYPLDRAARMERHEDGLAVDEAEHTKGRDEHARPAARKPLPFAPPAAVPVARRGDEVDLLAQATAVVWHDHDEPAR